MNYKKNSLLLGFVLFISCNLNFKNNPPYIVEEVPEEVPLKFAEGFISIDTLSEFGSVFSEDTKEFYFIWWISTDVLKKYK
jgi:hypothetical protein